MLIIDSSVWIEELRSGAGGFPAFGDLKSASADQFAVTEPILMEVLAGARRFELVRSRLNALPLRGVEPSSDYDTAATLFRAARASDKTIRSLNDCLIAAVALRLCDTVVHRDADFEVLAAMTDLTTLDLR
ncbi:MAG: PIN domain-containing protein [Candidatus Nanopelagicales bacterium]|nr:PIN domain-containing protein [Candidatus Nanopelagicales bacterium]